jgi:hypothetical protein
MAVKKKAYGSKNVYGKTSGGKKNVFGKKNVYGSQKAARKA